MVKRKRPAKRTTKKTTKPKSSSRKQQEDGLCCVLYGVSGVGKTSLAGMFPNPYFIIDPQEFGINDLTKRRLIPEPVGVSTVEDWEQTLDTVAEVAYMDDVQTIVVDSLTGIEKLCFLHHCKKYFEDDWSEKGFYAFQRGPKNAAKKDWPILLDQCNVAIQNGKNVLLLAHSQIKTFSDPEGPDYDRHIPYLDKETWAQTHRWASMVLFYNYNVQVKKGTATKAKATSQYNRFIHLDWSPAFDAKNRMGLVGVVDATDGHEAAYENLIKTIGG